jgi:hypothetical protein
VNLQGQTELAHRKPVDARLDAAAVAVGINGQHGLDPIPQEQRQPAPADDLLRGVQPFARN